GAVRGGWGFAGGAKPAVGESVGSSVVFEDLMSIDLHAAAGDGDCEGADALEPQAAWTASAIINADDASAVVAPPAWAPRLRVGSGDGARKSLSMEEVVAIVRAEIADRRAAAEQYVRLRPTRRRGCAPRRRRWNGTLPNGQ